MAREDAYTAAATYRDLVRRESHTQAIDEKPSHDLAAAVTAGLSAALLAALLWAALTVATGYNFAFAALGVGLMVGCAVRVAGNGSQLVFGLIGAALSVLGCALGNVMASCAYAANLQGLPVVEVMGQLNFSLALEILVAGSGPFDVILFAAAAYEGYRISVN